jgi:hypothetical protein
MNNTTGTTELTASNQLSSERHTRLRIEYGHYLESLPSTCSLETRIERFRSWLQERDIRLEALKLHCTPIPEAVRTIALHQLENITLRTMESDRKIIKSKHYALSE